MPENRADPQQRAPRVSVVVPCFNYEQHLPGTIASVLAQTYDDFEIVIVDDGSTDRSAEVAEELIAAHPGGRIRLIRQDNCGHPSITRNNGIASSEGEYVLCLDADDEIEPRFLELCVAALDANPQAGVAFTDQKDFGASDFHHRVAPYDFDSLKHQNCFGICSVFRRAAWEAAGGWDPLIPFEDWDFWIGCGASGWHGIKVEGTAWRYRTSDSGRFQKLVAAGDAEVKAKMVLKRPQIYTDAQQAWARGVLDGDPRWAATPHDFGYIPRVPQPVEGASGALALDTRGFVALAFAAELVAHPEMLRAWADAFSAADDATLLVYAPEHEFGALAAQLTERLGELGLSGDPQGPDMLALPVASHQERAVRGRADVVYTRGSGNATLPRFDDSSLTLLRSLIADRLEPKRTPRVLCYAPYNKWALHGQWEMAVLHGLRMRGAEVHYLLCDGLYSDCDVFWEATNPRRPGACTECQADVTRLVADMGMDFEWLGRYLMPDDQREARRWTRELQATELPQARYGDWHVGAWVTGSVHSHLRVSHLDLADPRVEKAYRSYVYSALVASFALDRALTDIEPDVLFTFSGRLSSTRVAYELARARGIRTVVHERGPRHETLALTADNSCVSLEPIRRFWREWGEVPLTAAEVEDVDRLLFERAHGENTGWRPLTPAPQPLDEVCAELDLDPGRPIWVVFTSSDDEVVFEPDWQGGITSQVELIERTAAFAAAHPAIQLVVRVHPNTGSRRSNGANRQQLEEMEALRNRLPAVRMVMPEDEISSYTLIELCTVGVISHSTIGLELACRGKATVSGSGSVLTGTPFAHTVDEPDRYEELLEGLLDLPVRGSSLEVRRLAYRMAYGVFFRTVVPFPLLRMEESHVGVPQWASPQDLAPGRDAALDRCTRILLDAEPVCTPPDAAALGRSDADELAFFEASEEEPARFTALAFADELIEDPSLLEAWAATFSGADLATLVVHTPADATERLVHAVARAGLEGEGTPDLLAIDPDSGALDSVDAVYSRREQPQPPLATAPRFDDASAASLRHFADACTGR